MGVTLKMWYYTRPATTPQTHGRWLSMSDKSAQAGRMHAGVVLDVARAACGLPRMCCAVLAAGCNCFARGAARARARQFSCVWANKDLFWLHNAAMAAMNVAAKNPEAVQAGAQVASLACMRRVLWSIGSGLLALPTLNLFST